MRRISLRRVRVTPSLVISAIALFVALSSTGVAATIVPLAKRALTADTAKVAKRAITADKANTAATATSANTATTAGDATTLGGQTAAQIAATPGPASSLPGAILTLRSVGWSIQSVGTKTDAKALCTAGEKAISGGFDEVDGAATVTYNRPLQDLSGWQFQVQGLPEDALPANGSVWVVCAKVS